MDFFLAKQRCFCLPVLFFVDLMLVLYSQPILLEPTNKTLKEKLCLLKVLNFFADFLEEVLNFINGTEETDNIQCNYQTKVD